MKKVMTLLAMLAIPFAMMAQTKFHDVELNEATGPVKSISTSVMGRDQVTTFTQDGKMQREGMSNPVYDAEGYMQSMNMMGQDMNIPFTDYKYDEKGNWISRKSSMMGQEVEQTRKIEYYE